MKVALSALLGIALCVTGLSAQTTFRANLDGFQETPPIPGTFAGGYALLTLNANNTITYDVHTFGLSGTAAHIHKGAPGVAGAIVFPLSGGPTEYTGTTPVLTAPQQDDLFAGAYYVNVHTTDNPNGEIRGQVGVSPNVFGARLDGAQETPPNSSPAKGNATFVLNPDLTITYNVTTTGLVGGTNAHLHLGAVGVAGGIEVPLAGGPTVWSGTSADVSPDDIKAMQTLGMYVNVHTLSKPAGEIRGQVVGSGSIYGPSSDPPTGTITLASSGAPTDEGGGGTFTLSITHGKPFGAGSLAISIGDASALLNLEPLLVNIGSLITLVALPLDGSGSLVLPAVTPPLPATVDIYLQFFGFDTSAPNSKFNASNGLKLRLQHF